MSHNQKESAPLGWLAAAGVLALVIAALPSACIPGEAGPGPDDRLPDGGLARRPDGGTTGTVIPQKFADGCVGNEYQPPAGPKCTAECGDCDCNRISYVCPKECYAAGANCGIAVDPTGKGSSTSGAGGGCMGLACVPEDDTSKELTCSASECKLPYQNVQVSPAPDVNVNRAPRNAGLVFVVDTSASMTERQMASACAAQSFATAANGGVWSAGVMTMDLTRWINPTTQAPLNAAPAPLQTTSCGAPLACSCPLVATSRVPCMFSPGGTLTQSSDPSSVQKLQELLVQGNNEAGVGFPTEGGLEKAFLYVLGEWRAGRKTSVGQVVAVTDEEADADAFVCPIQAKRQTNLPAYQSVLGAAFVPPANTGNCKADLTAFYIYAFKYMNVQVNALCDTDGRVNEVSKIYPAVAAATGGHVANIGRCETFTDFFTKVGFNTATLSTNICQAQALDPATLVVTFVPASGGPQVVPQSATDGWTYDAMLKCVVFKGSWETKYGNYRLNQGSGSGGTSQVCLPADKRPTGTALKVTVKGAAVPKSTTEGWTYDPAVGCLELHGSWSSNPGPFDIQYL